MIDRILGDVDHVPAPQRHRPRLHGHVSRGTDEQATQYILAEANALEAVQGSWIAAENPVEVKP